MTQPSTTQTQLNAIERSISIRLALVFALRMFGLFVVLPVLAPYALGLPLGFGITHATPAQTGMAVGLAMGAYGLTQAFFYIPYGLASDQFGRKPIITLGLIIFAVGSVWASTADTIYGLAMARALQGMGAISSVVVAMVADTTRSEVRTRAMAMIGMSIALTFALSLIVAPILFDSVGMHGIFLLIAVLALIATGLVWSIPLAPLSATHAPISSKQAMQQVLNDKRQWLLNFGVFILHAIQMAMWVVIPSRLIGLSLSHQQSTYLYLIVILISMGAMIPLIIRAEKYGKMFEIMRIAIVLIVIAQIILASQIAGVWGVAVALLLFFLGFNVLEATQPSLLSKLTHPATKGAASGVYNTVQALGLFTGAMIGAWLNAHWGVMGLFVGTALMALAWLVAHQVFAQRLQN
jgi:MFS family permease